MLLWDNCQASLHNTNSFYCHTEKESENEHQYICRRSQERAGEGDVKLWGTNLRAEPFAMAFCCQITTRCAKCVQTGMTAWRQFSAICQILASPSPLPLSPSPHASWKTNTNIRGAHRISNRLPQMLSPFFASSAVMWWEIYSVTYVCLQGVREKKLYEGFCGGSYVKSHMMSASVGAKDHKFENEKKKKSFMGVQLERN